MDMIIGAATQRTRFAEVVGVIVAAIAPTLSTLIPGAVWRADMPVKHFEMVQPCCSAITLQTTKRSHGAWKRRKGREDWKMHKDLFFKGHFTGKLGRAVHRHPWLLYLCYRRL
jgi:hypothetical protein